MESLAVERLKKYGPITYIMLVFWSLLYQMLYYKHFGVTITNYIDISETLLFLSDTFLQAVGFAMIGMLLVGMLFKLPFDIFNFVRSLFKKEPFKADEIIAYLTIFGGVFIVMFSVYYFDPLNVFSAWFGGMLSTTTAVENPKFNKMGIGFMITFITCTLIMSALNRSRTLPETGKRIEIVYDDERIDNAGNILVGETKNYVFVFSNKDSVTTAINRTQILMIKTETRKKLNL